MDSLIGKTICDVVHQDTEVHITFTDGTTLSIEAFTDGPCIDSEDRTGVTDFRVNKDFIGNIFGTFRETR